MPTPAAAGTYIPGTGATSSAAEIVDPAGTFSPASASAPILAAAGTYVPGAGATFYAAERVDLAATYSGSGASALTLAAAATYIPITGATPAAAEIVDPAGAYSLAGASAATIDPAGRDSAAGAGAPTLAAPDAYIPVIEATSAARKIVSPPACASTSPGSGWPGQLLIECGGMRAADLPADDAELWLRLAAGVASPEGLDEWAAAPDEGDGELSETDSAVAAICAIDHFDWLAVITALAGRRAGYVRVSR